MNIHDYLIEQDGIDWMTVFSDWRWLLPAEFTLWLVNRFAELVIVTPDVQCFGFIQPPVLGGEYEQDNIMTIKLPEYISYMGTCCRTDSRPSGRRASEDRGNASMTGIDHVCPAACRAPPDPRPIAGLLIPERQLTPPSRPFNNAPGSA